MALGYRKVVLVEQADDFVFCFWQRLAIVVVYNFKECSIVGPIEAPPRARPLTVIATCNRVALSVS
jgi:hypothetical protein